MKIAFMADAHARGKDLDVFRMQWAAAFHLAAASGCDLVVHCGDLFDTPAIGDKHATPDEVITAVLNPVREYLDGDGTRCFIEITGNHSAANDRQMIHAGAALKAVNGATVVNSPRSINLSTLGYDTDIVLCAVPWVYGSDAEEEVRECLECESTARPLLLAAHMQVLGAKLNALKTCEDGSFTIARDSPAIDSFDYIALGDFHMRQRLFKGDDGRDRGGYVGALRQLNFGEEGNPAGFEIYDTETKQVEWIELEAAPKYNTIPWVKGQPRPKATGTYERVVAAGWTPGAEDIRAIESSGARVEIVTDRAERVARAEIDGTTLHNDTKLFDLWLSTLSEPGDAAVLQRAKEVLAQ